MAVHPVTIKQKGSGIIAIKKRKPKKAKRMRKRL